MEEDSASDADDQRKPPISDGQGTGSWYVYEFLVFLPVAPEVQGTTVMDMAYSCAY